MNYHLIAIGGSIMHNLAIDLLDLGHKVTGSDDEIYEPSRSKLESRGLLPQKLGWDGKRISPDINTIILGKHAKEDNPELQVALKLGLTIQSFPEFIASSTTATQRIAITGSHGKTSTTAMAMYVMKKLQIDFDYLVGAQIEGFDKMVRMSGADILIVEGDEYPSSALDMRAKMLHYNANISVITGVAWDHVNIYKTYKDYKQIFIDYLDKKTKEDLVFFDQSDSALLDMVLDKKYACKRIGYEHLEISKKGEVIWNTKTYPIQVFGRHNMKNMNAARLVCNQLGVSTEDFLLAIKDFTGAAKRLETISQTENRVVYKDFAHAPSKAEATAEAVRARYPKARIFGLLELHTFSSLSMDFIEQYNSSLDSLDDVVVFYDPAAVALKRMPDLEAQKVKSAFNHHSLQIINSSIDLDQKLKVIKESDFDVVLIMSSGNLGGLIINHYFH